MAIVQWFNPTNDQIVEAQELATRLGTTPEWDGHILSVTDPTPPPPTPVPAAVTARQARLALLGAGLLETVEQVLSSMEGPQGAAARIEWEYAVSIDRDSMLINALAPALGITSDQIDDLFRAAGEI